MEMQEVHSQIVEVVKRHCGSRKVTGLLGELRTAGSLGAGPGRRGTGRATECGPVQTHSDGEFLDHMITLCRTVLDREEEPAALLEMGDVLKANGQMQKAADLFSMVLSDDRGPVKKKHIAEAFMRRGELHSRLGQWKASQADLARSRTLFVGLREQVALGRVENILATNYAEQGNLKLARKCYTRALSIFEESDQKEMAGTVLMNLGILLNIAGKYDEALGHYTRALSLFEQLGDVCRLAELHHNIGMTYLQWGQESAAIKEFNCSHYLASRRNLLPVMGLALFGKANAHYRIGDYPLAANFLQHAIGAFERCDDRLGLADAYKLKGMCHRDMKKYALATSYFLTSLRMNRELKNRLNEAETWFEMGLLERQRRRKEETLKAFTEALAIFKEIGAAADVKRTEQEICTTNGGRHVS